MKKKPSEKSRPRAEILAEIAALPPSVQGTISSYRCPRKNGPPAVYHNLQYTRGGKNHSFSIPVDKVSEFKAAVAAGRKLRDLVFELSLADANEIASSGSALKNEHAGGINRTFHYVRTVATYSPFGFGPKRFSPGLESLQRKTR